ncbi:hypothetical protein PLAN_100644 [Planktothrix rubescens CCAP 1459/22]|uniref:Uncharacterized protein n=1 Tax=Planktothrix rubescens CCAP 1459/22 TaxID=329571 RepID=A0A6J7ZGL2_PLARU|nr:hypothetical protein PLAN_100644 [Planktothrix rubescens NIVA-CYA 18]
MAKFNFAVFCLFLRLKIFNEKKHLSSSLDFRNQVGFLHLYLL